MPELPEVESVRRSLQPHLIGRTIRDVQALYPGAVSNDPATFKASLLGQRFGPIERFGKYLAYSFESGAFLMMHLRMTGRAIFTHGQEPVDSHCRIRFFLDAGDELRFSDMRKFGRVAFASNREALERLFTLGPEPLTKAFTVDSLGRALSGRAKVKPALLDQRRVAGLGNIYVDESLFRAGIHPERTVDTLSAEEIENLHAAIEGSIRDALAHGGTTIRNYVQGDGRPGEYKDHLRVYGRFGEDCVQCATTLQRIRVGGRGTTFCPKCQEWDG